MLQDKMYERLVLYHERDFSYDRGKTNLHQDLSKSMGTMSVEFACNKDLSERFDVLNNGHQDGSGGQAGKLIRLTDKPHT